MVSQKRRVLGNMVVVFAYVLGNSLVGAAAWGLLEWRKILWAINGPALLFVSYIWYIKICIKCI